MLDQHVAVANDGAGLRRPTTANRAASALADSYDGLPDGVTRWRLAAALRAAARPLGLGGGLLRLLEHYIDLTYDQDWERGAEPIIARPVIEIAEHLGRSERQVRNLERALVDKGLLAWRDSGNHHRRGRRDRASGRLVYAYGPSLAPLGVRAAEIIALAHTARAEIAAGRRMRIVASAARRRIRASLAIAAAAGVDADDIAMRLQRIPERAAAGWTLTALAARTNELESLAAILDARLTDAAADPTGQHVVDISTEAEICSPHDTETSNKNFGNCNAVAAESRSRAPTELDATSQRLPLPLALAATGDAIKNAMTLRGDEGWRGLIDAACDVAPLLGIGSTLWAEACRRLGRRDAALAIVIIERGVTKRAEDGVPIRRPDAYLRGLMARADAGELRLARSIHSWAQRSESSPRHHAGAVPGAPKAHYGASPPRATPHDNMLRWT